MNHEHRRRTIFEAIEERTGDAGALWYDKAFKDDLWDLIDDPRFQAFCIDKWFTEHNGRFYPHEGWGIENDDDFVDRETTFYVLKPSIEERE